MKRFLVLIGATSILAAGCATKKYVRATAAPIQARVDQVAEQAAKNTQSIEETRAQLKQVDDSARSGISAAQERTATADQQAMTADQHAGAALTAADKANQTADKTLCGLDGLRDVVANIADHKLQTTVTVQFRFDKHSLTGEARQDLDGLAAMVKSDKRFLVTVEGFTDRTGSTRYNESLSRRRADTVVAYLVGKHDVPVYRIHMLMGERKPVDNGKAAAAGARNRRVEVRLYSSDQVTEATTQDSRGSAAERAAENPSHSVARTGSEC